MTSSMVAAGDSSGRLSRPELAHGLAGPQSVSFMGDLISLRWGSRRGEAIDRMNLGYAWHAMCTIIYLIPVMLGRVIVTVYGLGSGDRLLSSDAPATELSAPVGAGQVPEFHYRMGSRDRTRGNT